jgi:hypothetical protein
MITDILKENNKVLEIILNTENEPHIDNLINNQIELNNNAINLVQDELLSDVIVPKGTVCELNDWDGGDETNLCNCGEGDGTCRKQTAL